MDRGGTCRAACTSLGSVPTQVGGLQDRPLCSSVVGTLSSGEGMHFFTGKGG